MLIAFVLLSLVSLFFVEETKKLRLFVIMVIAAWLIFELHDTKTDLVGLVLVGALGLHRLLTWNDTA